ncbi:MAG: hypothetical protein IT380_30000 [Myxococcales bacterium]|nr:hypothetical protein [Myxococcales bacterium]
MDRVIGALGWGDSREEQCAALEARVADRLLEREALRGDKTDDQYQLMLESALKRLSVLAGLATAPAAPRTEDRLVETLAMELRLPYAEWKLRKLLAQQATARFLAEVRLLDGGAKQQSRRVAEAVERLNCAAYALKQLGRGEARRAMEVATREAVRWFRAMAAPRS